MNNKLKNMGGSRQKYYLLGAIVLIVIAGIFYFGIESATYEPETFAVMKDEFIIDVYVPGELKARQSVKISAPMEIRSSLQIVEMVTEGYNVEEGDMLIRFDTADLENNLLDADEELATQLQALEELKVQLKSDSVQNEAEMEIQELTFEQSELRFSRAEFEPENSKRQMEIDMEKAKLQLQQQRLDHEREKKNAKERLQRELDRIQRQENEIEEIYQQIEESVIYAPSPGLVVYQKTRSGSEEVKIKVGDEVHRRQELMELPDLSEILVSTAVNEVDVSKVKRRQEVIVTLDANENVYYGTVTDIGRLARRESSTLGNSIKVIDTEVTIENTEGDESLIPGMTATCRIITDRIPDVMQVPLTSVFADENGNEFVYVKNGGSYDRTYVTIGAKNRDYIVIEDGLEVGQLVTLRDPYRPLEGIGTEIKERAASTVAAPQQAPAPGQFDMQNIQRMMREGGGFEAMRGRGRSGDANVIIR